MHIVLLQHCLLFRKICRCYHDDMPVCLNCKHQLNKKINRYCSNQCQLDYKYRVYITKWRRGEVDGGRGIVTRNISGHLKRYLRIKYGDECSLCGWHEISSRTNKVPLEIDHIDGNSENNTEVNLRLICPNCHSLTANFRNLNKGNGRDWRRLKYSKLNSTPP